MKLNPVIASYSGESFFAIRQYLTEDVLDIVATVASPPRHPAEIPPDVLTELVEMHVLTTHDGTVTLNTAVFLSEDIARISERVRPLAAQLARCVLESGSAFRNASPQLTIVLGGHIGLVQGLGMALKQSQTVVDWKSYQGKYAQSKVDFDELCPALERLWPDVLNKTVLHGERYTALFLGPNGNTFGSLLCHASSSTLQREYSARLNRYLVDAYADLVQGVSNSAALRAAGESAGMYQRGSLRAIVITSDMIQKYERATMAITETTSSYYQGQIDALQALLRSTTAGRQGTPTAAMMLHLWRYIRRLTAQELYATGFFRDDIPENGPLTVFYENDAALMNQFLR